LPEDIVLEVAHARKQFAQRSALNGVDLTLRSGELYVLLGANGAGKTTLLRAICGRVSLDAGSVRVEGLNPRRDRSARGLLGVVPQRIALYPHLTARENLTAFGRLAGIRGDTLQAAVESGLSAIGLSERADDLSETLSGGMQRRLNIAAGALHQPRLLLLDEPTVGVDPGARENIHEMLATLRQRGVTVLMTTHDLEQAEALADRVGFLVDGRIELEGTPSDLVKARFGNARQLIVSLHYPADDAAGKFLESEGMQALSDGLTWIGTVDGGLSDLARVAARLSAEGVSVDELRIREPGLRGVYFQLTGRDLRA